MMRATLCLCSEASNYVLENSELSLTISGQEGGKATGFV